MEGNVGIQVRYTEETLEVMNGAMVCGSERAIMRKSASIPFFDSFI